MSNWKVTGCPAMAVSCCVAACRRAARGSNGSSSGSPVNAITIVFTTVIDEPAGVGPCAPGPPHATHRTKTQSERRTGRRGMVAPEGTAPGTHCLAVGSRLKGAPAWTPSEPAACALEGFLLLTKLRTMNATPAVVPVGTGDPLSEPSLARELAQRFLVWDAFVAGRRRVDVHPLVLPASCTRPRCARPRRSSAWSARVAARAHDDERARALRLRRRRACVWPRRARAAGDARVAHARRPAPRRVGPVARVRDQRRLSGRSQRGARPAAARARRGLPGGPRIRPTSSSPSSSHASRRSPTAAPSASCTPPRTPRTCRSARSSPASSSAPERAPSSRLPPRRASAAAISASAATPVRRALPVLPDRVDERPAQRAVISPAPSSWAARAHAHEPLAHLRAVEARLRARVGDASAPSAHPRDATRCSTSTAATRSPGSRGLGGEARDGSRGRRGLRRRRCCRDDQWAAIVDDARALRAGARRGSRSASSRSGPIPTPWGDRLVTLGAYVLDGRFAGYFARITAQSHVSHDALCVPVFASSEAP